MQTVWKGSVSFGLVSIPVRLVSATEERDLSFHQVRAADGSRVRYKRVAEADGQEVSYSAIAKSYTTPDGREVVLTDEDLAAVKTPSSRTVELIGFVAAAEIDPLTLTKSYFAEPAADDRKPYALLRDALVASERVAVVKITLRNRERLGVLRPRGDVLVLQTMLWPDEVRTPDFATDANSPVRPQELTMAESYIEALSGELDLTEQSDQYRTALLELVNAKAAGIEPAPEQDTDADRPGAQVVDLVEALRRSVEAAGGRRRGADGGAAPAAPVAQPAEEFDDPPAEAAAPARKRAPAKKAAGGPRSKAGSGAAGASPTKAGPTKAGAPKAVPPATTSRRTAAARAKAAAQEEPVEAAPRRRVRKSA